MVIREELEDGASICGRRRPPARRSADVYKRQLLAQQAREEVVDRGDDQLKDGLPPGDVVHLEVPGCLLYTSRCV